MSFQDLEAGRPVTGGSNKVNGKKDATQGVVSGIFQITTSVSTFQRLVNTLGTPKDTPELREKLHKTRLHIGQLVKETSAKLKQASETDHHAGVSQSKKIADAKLAKDFQAVLKEFQKAQRLSAEREKVYTPFVPQAVLPSSYTAGEIDVTSEKSPEQRALLVESRSYSMGGQHGIQKIRILLVVFFIGVGFSSNASSSSSSDVGGNNVIRPDSNSVSDNLNIRGRVIKKYLVEPYFEKYDSFVDSNFQDFIEDELLQYSCKSLPDNANDLFRLAVPKRLLIGEGSHRHLYSSIRFHFQSESVSRLPNFTSCKVVVLERLPSGVFADPFELQHLLQRGGFTDIAVFGDTNLELPSFTSNRSVVEVHMNISPNTLFGQTNVLEISIDLPLHVRYPPLGESGYAEIEFGAPDLLMKCSMEGNLSDQSCLFTPSNNHVESNSRAVLWRVPSGTRRHADMVSVVTFLSAFVSTLIIVITILFYSDTSCAKTFKSS